jgi:hypothetical protein
MTGGAPHWDRFARWPRGAARAVLAAIVLVLALAAWTALPATAPADSPGPAAAVVRDADLQLYDRIAVRVAGGDSYYRAALAEQRAASFPVRPGVAVRLPTMAYLSAVMGGEALGAMILLAALAAAAWYVRLGEEPGGAERRIVAVALLLAGMAAGLNSNYLVLHEVWAGLLVALAIGLHRPGRWHWAWLAAAAALAIREHALPFVLLLGAMAAWRRDWRETAAWSALVVLFCAGLWLHVAQVTALLLPGDRPADGWLALRGLRGLTSNLAATSPLQFLPMWLAAPLALLPLIGWAGWKSPLGTFAALLCAGYGLLFMIAGRDNNFYWALVVTPVWFVGLAFVPLALRSLWRRAAG